MEKKIEIPPEFYRTLEKALDTFSLHEVFYLEYIALKMHAWLHTKITRNPIILDIGSGYGLLTHLLQILFNAHSAYGIDIDQEAILHAQKMYPSVSFKQCNKAEIPFEDGIFDVVYVHSAFHHISRQDHIRYCAEIHRVLKPGGIAVIIELNPYNIFTRAAFRNDPYEQGLEMLKPKYIKHLLKNYGKTSIHYFGFFQQWFVNLRFLEPYISKIPFGSLYALFLCKNNKTSYKK